MPKTESKQRPLWARRLCVMTPLAVAWLGWSRLQRYYRPANAELALFEGLELTRGQRRVLAITAHPDDLEAMAGGTLRLMALAGSEIHVAVLSDGRKQANSRSNLGEIRQMEQQHAANIIGYAKLHYLGFRDLGLSRIPTVKSDLESVFASVKPEVLFSFDSGFPEPYIVHPDHLTAGRLAVEISRTHPDAKVYLYGTRETNVVTDISAVIEDKIQAVLAHQSQLQAAPALYAHAIRTYAWLRGRPVQLNSAEGFRELRMSRLTEKSYCGQWTR